MSDLASSSNRTKANKLFSSSSLTSNARDGSRLPNQKVKDSTPVSDSAKDGDNSSEAETVIMDSTPSKVRKHKRLKRRRSSSDEIDFWSDNKPTKHTSAHERNNSSEPVNSRLNTDSNPKNGLKTLNNGTSRSPMSRSNSPGVAATSGSRKNRAGRDANGRLKLQRMCDKGKYEDAKELILNGADVNDRDYAGNTAIHEAALKGHTRIVELLIDNGAIIDIRSGPYDLDTPLIDAVANDHIDVVRLLLQRGADPRIYNAQGKTSMDSIQDDNINGETIERLLREASIKFRRKREADRATPGADGSDDPDSHQDFMDPANYPSGTFPPKVNDNPVTTTAPKRGGARAQAIRNDLLWMDLTTRTGREQVYRKAADGDIEFVGNCLENGWKPDADCLALAAKHGHTDVVGLLLAFGADSDELTEDGDTALHQAIGRGHFATVKLLLDSGANPRTLNHAGKSCLELAQESVSSDDKEVAFITQAMKSFNDVTKPSPEATESAGRHRRQERERVKGDAFEKKGNLSLDERLSNDEDLLYRKKKRKLVESDVENPKRSDAYEVKVAKHARTEPKSSEQRSGAKLIPAIFKKEGREEERRLKLVKARQTEKPERNGHTDLKKRTDSDAVPLKRKSEQNRSSPNDSKQPKDSHRLEESNSEFVSKGSSEKLKKKLIPEDKKRTEEFPRDRGEIDSKKLRDSNFKSKDEYPHEKSSETTSDVIRLKRPTEDKKLIEESAVKKEPTSRKNSDSILHVKSRHNSANGDSIKVSSQAQEGASLNDIHRKVPSTAIPPDHSKMAVSRPDVKTDASPSLSSPSESKFQERDESSKGERKSEHNIQKENVARELLISKREKERKEREKKMLVQLEMEEKRKVEKRKMEEELEKQQKERQRQQELEQQAKDVAAGQARQRQLQASASAEARKNQPYGLRIAKYGTRSITETLEYLPLFSRRFRTGAAASGMSDKVGSYVIDMQVALLLGVRNIYQACEYYFCFSFFFFSYLRNCY